MSRVNMCLIPVLPPLLLFACSTLRLSGNVDLVSFARFLSDKRLAC